MRRILARVLYKCASALDDRATAITGLWLRSSDHVLNGRIQQYVQVLVEQNGTWRRVGDELITGGVLSHIYEKSAIIAAPVDNL